MSFNILDYLIILFFLATLVNSFKKGFIKAVSGFTSVIIAMVLALLFYSDLLIYLNYNFNLNGLLTEIIYEKWTLPALVVETSLFTYALPLETYFLDLRDKLVCTSLVIISFAIIFIVSFLILKIIWSFIGKLFSIGFLSFFNKTLGAILFTLKNFLIFLILLRLLTPILELLSQIGLIYATIAYNLIISSVIANYLLQVIITTIG